MVFFSTSTVLELILFPYISQNLFSTIPNNKKKERKRKKKAKFVAFNHLLTGRDDCSPDYYLDNLGFRQSVATKILSWSQTARGHQDGSLYSWFRRGRHWQQNLNCYCRCFEMSLCDFWWWRFWDNVRKCNSTVEVIKSAKWLNNVLHQYKVF